MLSRFARVCFSKQQKLFTPGPLNTTMSVKQAMMIDYGSRDPVFLKELQTIREGILEVAESDSKHYSPVIIQGSGTYAIEATLHTCVNKKTDKVLVVTNGSYGERQVEILRKAGNRFDHLEYQDDQLVRPEDIIKKLDNDLEITHVSMVHSETTSGLLNPINWLKNGYTRPIHLIVDAMSSFGAYHTQAQSNNIDFLISSSNKCIQGAPGFAFVIANTKALEKYRGNATSTVLDLVDQEETMVKTNQFRFTPPTHVLVAFAQALKEHKLEGGVDGRNKRYSELQQMEAYGFRPYLSKDAQGCIITTFYEPDHPNYNFKKMYDYLANKGLVIYPGKKTKAPTFRIGSIGEITKTDMEELVTLLGQYLKDSKIPIPVPYK